MYCPICKHEGKAKKVTKGSIIIEIFLWCMMLVPGFIYSLWRLTTRHDACPQCGNANLLKVKPVEQKIA